MTTRARCPRCHSSMLIDSADVYERWELIWKCLGCGREFPVDPLKRAEEERLLHQVRQGDPVG